MNLNLYNTASRSVEVFAPLEERQVRMYVCGPTVYDFAHIGNARPVVVFDVLYRLLKTIYEQVIYVRNITDVDDKINAKSKESGESIYEITKRTTQCYHEDMAALGALNPDIEPKATDHIDDMVAMIERLIDKGFAYEAQGHVLFDANKYENYGKLSGRDTDQLLAGARVEVAPYKKNPMDFVLWKPSISDTPGWNSPWGFGRPGWHIECSAMSYRYLGETFDIHGGGIDLVFPHHENEIAQSCCANETSKMARFWMHNGHLTIEGEKMSKSLGNFLTVRTLLKSYPGEVIRLSLLSAHYRQPLLWSEALIAQSYQTLNRFYGALRGYDQQSFNVNQVDESVKTALFDDLNTPLVLSHLHILANAIYKAQNLDEKKALQQKLAASCNIIGLCFKSAQEWFQTLKGDISAEQVEEMIIERNKARQEKNYQKADDIRNQLLTNNIILEDTPNGTLWRQSF